MKKVYLKFPTFEDKDNVLEFKNEFLSSGQTMAGVAGLNKIDSFEEWLVSVNNALNKETCAEGKVPATLYLTYRLSDNKLVGMVQIRHFLNDNLLMYGGHIGDCIRPSEQGKGYATEQLALALKECKKLGIEKVLITCKKKNVASARTIQKNNGVLENEVIENGEEKQRYWIDLSE